MKKYDTLEYSKVRCYSGDSVRLQNIYSIGHKKRQHWSSTGPGGGQVKYLLDAIATSKNKGITGDHWVFSFVSRRIQPLQCRKHPAFRYEGTKDPTRLSSEAMSRAEVGVVKYLTTSTTPWCYQHSSRQSIHLRRCGWVLRSIVEYLEVSSLVFWWIFFLQKNYKTWYCMPPSSEDAAHFDGMKKRKEAPGSLLQRKPYCLDSG